MGRCLAQRARCQASRPFTYAVCGQCKARVVPPSWRSRPSNEHAGLDATGTWSAQSATSTVPSSRSSSATVRRPKLRTEPLPAASPTPSCPEPRTQPLRLSTECRCCRYCCRPVHGPLPCRPAPVQEEEASRKRARTEAHAAQQYTASARGAFEARRTVHSLMAGWRCAEQLDDAAGLPQPNDELLAQLPAVAERLAAQQAAVAAAAAGIAEEGAGRASTARAAVQGTAPQSSHRGEDVAGAAGLGKSPEGIETVCGCRAQPLPSQSTPGRPSGPQQAAHSEAGVDTLRGGGDTATATPAAVSSAVQPPLADQLRVLLLYLRERHCYCFFCGCAYGGAADMAANCPGITEDEH